MNKILLFISATFLLFSCSSTLTTIKDPSLKPNSYQKVLLVTETFHSNESGFKKFFNIETRNSETVSNISKRIIETVQKNLKNEQKNSEIHFVKKNLNKGLILNNDNSENNTQQEIEGIVLEKHIDLVITIYPKDIRRSYNGGGISTGIGIGNPNYGLNATTNSSNLRFTYIFTAIDTKTQLEVWKGSYDVENANNIFTNIPKKVSKKLLEKFKEDQLF